MFRYHQQFLPIPVTPFELTLVLLRADFRTSVVIWLVLELYNLIVLTKLLFIS